ncbi:MAG: flagellar filament outer layer protein FlaA [Treponema sp.]|nr:flagellar filament outer layer protein FlaA [Treponema sp.]
MKKSILTVAALLLAAGMAFAQEGNKSLADPNSQDLGTGSAASALREVSIEKFERDGAWNVHISPDAGVISARLFEGGPAAKEALEEDKDKDNDTHVLGVKVEFFRRGVNSIYITAVRPLPIEGVTKTISMWVAGRNQNHDLWVLVQDYFGHNYELYMGNLGFSGWKQMTLAVPPSEDGEHGIVQSSPYYGDRPGLRIVGFRIDCNPMLARGTYFVYFDDLRAVTDLYEMQNRDEDDMPDNW